MQPAIAEVLERRRNRSIAIILGVKERDCDQFLTEEASNRLRKVVLDQLNEYHDFIVDIFRTVDTSEQFVVNEHFLDKIDAIYNQVVRKGIMIAGDNGTR